MITRYLDFLLALTLKPRVFDSSAVFTWGFSRNIARIFSPLFGILFGVLLDSFESFSEEVSFVLYRMTLKNRPVSINSGGFNPAFLQLLKIFLTPLPHCSTRLISLKKRAIILFLISERPVSIYYIVKDFGSAPGEVTSILLSKMANFMSEPDIP